MLAMCPRTVAPDPQQYSHPLHADTAALQGVPDKGRLPGQGGAVTVTPIQLSETKTSATISAVPLADTL